MKNLSLFNKLLKIDWVLVLLLVLLVSIGCFSLYSAADGNWSPWATRHFQRGIIGILIALIIALIDLVEILKNPYQGHKKNSEYCFTAPKSDKKYQTFCGT